MTPKQLFTSPSIATKTAKDTTVRKMKNLRFFIPFEPSRQRVGSAIPNLGKTGQEAFI